MQILLDPLPKIISEFAVLKVYNYFETPLLIVAIARYLGHIVTSKPTKM